MFRVKIRVLLSLFCILSSCVFTVLFLFIGDNRTSTQITAKVRTKSMGFNDLMVEEVNLKDIEKEDIKNNKGVNNTNDRTTESEPEEVVEEVNTSPEIVYDGMTLDELASKLDRTFKNELSGKGYLYATYSLEKGVDPYLAAAISMEETGCNWNCSNLVKSCNNVGGMKGTGCGSYGYFNTLDDGIRSFIDNISRNYVAYGLTTAETMNSKYAENPAWATNVNNYINIIRNN